MTPWLRAAWVIVVLLPATLAQGQVNLRCRFVVGEKRRYTNRQQRDIRTQLKDRQVKQNLTRTTETTLVVEQVQPNGSARCRQTITRIVYKLTSPTGNLAYDSANKHSASDLSAARVQALELMVGTDFTFLVSPQGHVSEVKPSPKTVAKFATAGAGLMMPTVTAGIKYLTPVIVLPQKPVKPNDTWKDTMSFDIPGVGTVAGSITYVYLGSATPTSVPGENVEFVMNNVTLQSAQNGPVKTSVKEFLSSGTIAWDNRAGRLVRRKSTSTMNMAMTVNDQPMESVMQSVETLQLVAP